MAEETTTQAKTIMIGKTVIIRDFAEKLGMPPTQVIAELMKNGIMSGQNERIDFDTAEIIASEFSANVVLEEGEKEGEGVAKLEQELAEGKEKKKTRPPVVVIMGHVDHGKTKLLDAIRTTNVVDEESGGITQHIGAYQVEKKGRKITFIDTPGHEAFTAMRSRGARVADIAILVIAADDSVQPQTKEAMGIIKKAGLPMLVAINKVDKPDANVDKVKTDLSEAGIQPEDWGGKTIMVPVSAKEGTGIEDLLDMVLLTADLEKNRIQADPGRQAIGTIIESHVDPGEGAVATVLVQAGTLHDGDVLTVGDTWGKVKMLKDWTGKRVQAAPPAFPVQILGLKGSPQVGDILEVVEDTKEFRRARKKVVARRPAVAQDVAASIPQEEEGEEEALTIKELNIVLKADTLGSLEAIEAQIGKLHHEDLKITIVSKGLGNITEADVLRTETSDALLMGFSVHPLAATEDVARGKHVEIHTYSIIYDLVNDVIAAGEALLEPEVTQELHGELQVLAVFLTKRKSMIFGGKVTKGKIVDKSDVIILREGQPVGEGKLIELESNKVKAKEVAQGSECGMKYEGPPIVQVGDTVRSLTRKTVQKKIQVR